jgi:predicted ATPase/DNA-binding SARP family transcriptional activator
VPGMVSIAVDVLGPLRLIVAGAPVDVRGPKRCAVLALLALAQGHAVTVDHLVDALWPDEPPESGRAALHSHVSRLRRHLGPAAARLERLDGGYRLALAAGELDAARARALLARAALEDEPFDLLQEARALWRGPVLAGLTDVAPLAASATALDDLHREITDRLVACALETGQLTGVVDLAAESVAADPLREPAVFLLVRALAATGRASDALGAARAYRQRLAEETGLDPSPALGELERAVANGARPRPAAPARPSTRLIGRDIPLAELRRLLARERLVTLTGAGGVGKTRLALELAREADEPGVLLLAPVTDPAALPHALAAALRLQVLRSDVLAACVAHLATGPRLLIVDNCEHLLDAARDLVGTLLDGCPELTVLATSREPLALAAEAPYRLPPLPLPNGRAEPLAQVPAVAVFLDRAARVRPSFAPDADALRLVAAVVSRLDGLPLAIELAAGRLSGFSLQDLHDRLDRALDLLAGARRSTDARHRTLRATVEWSYALLTPDEQRLFRHLAVFADGVDLPTAEEVAADLQLPGDPGAALARLVDASMVEAVFEHSGTRYRMLETLRSFGLDRLRAAGEQDAAAARLVRWAVALADRIDAEQATSREPQAAATLGRELANLRAAWRLARERGDLDAAAALAVGLYDVTSWRDLTEPNRWAEELAADPALGGHPRAAAVLGSAGNAAYFRGEYAEAERLTRAGLALEPTGTGAWICLIGAAVAALAANAFDDVVARSLAAAATETRPAVPLGLAALGALYGGDPDRARDLQARSAAAATSPTTCGFAAYVAGEIANLGGVYDRAEAHYGDALAHYRTSGATFGTGITLVGLLSARTRAGRVHDALRGFRDVVDYWERAGNWTHQWTTLRNLADLLRTLGDPEPAALIDAAADAAPDAPPEPGRAARPDAPGRAEALTAARAAIARHLDDCGR